MNKLNFMKTNAVSFLFIWVIVCITGINFLIYSVSQSWGNGVLLFLALMAVFVGAVISKIYFQELPHGTGMLIAVLLVTFGIFAIFPQKVIGINGMLNKAINFIRFKSNEQIYLKKIKAIQDIGPRFVTFNWGGFMNNPTVLVFDESDEIGNLGSLKTDVWWAHVGKKSEFGVCAYGVQKISIHFYVVDFSC